ncbi:MAG: thiol-disulfide oxidoreductase DCC family protein [Christiangramia sp.]|uniref:thiol-disulfide oxidoreductase DCC family protein n=1 Tax=Christiangramia sp. TaxID=1931228 RepID=UPI0032428B13
MKQLAENKKIVLFDGVCNLCNSAIQLIIKHDKNDLFRFASLQSQTGRKLLMERGLDPEKLESVILIDPGVAYYRKSTAALEIAKHLSGGYSFLYLFIHLPEFLRDPVYDLIGHYRYRWFGKKDQCMIPTPELQSKFLD